VADNPYAPPKAEVKDRPVARAIEAKPKQVRYAVGLLCATFLLAIPPSFYEYQRAPGVASGIVIVLMSMLSLVMIFFIDRGHNWARICLLVLSVISLLSFIALYAEFLKYPALHLGLNIIILLFDGVATYLIFTRPGALWFKRIHAPTY
jgi:hypothetical protein